IEFAKSVGECYVIEELDPVIENHCKRLGVRVVGKDILPLLGEYSSNLIREAILKEKPKFSQVAEKMPQRPPVMCAGCPHRGVFYVLNQMKLTVTGDIGCYTLGAYPPLSSIDTTLCMGAGVGMAHGMEKAAGRDFAKNTVAVIGDSTFNHSGITGLIDIVYNKGTSVVMILDNLSTGMTGHQDHPSTGKTIRREPTHALDLVKLCEAVGVRRVNVIDPFDVAGLRALLRRELDADEPSVIITRRICVMLEKEKKNKYSLDTNLCKGCSICMKMGCPAIIKKDGVITNDPSLCAGCGLCAKLCKSGAFVEL
ncbi:MAG: thiamine pyrophosphate-dependent enzyme, partial [Defluviitaleaceae bacterium]|nr:thiamine pyrophosphate-dependent enzyme [Defluviitaleaceae bacterium]